MKKKAGKDRGKMGKKLGKLISWNFFSKKNPIISGENPEEKSGGKSGGKIRRKNQFHEKIKEKNQENG